jgi:hypothetical protein
MGTKRSGTPRRIASSAPQEAPALPVWKAFVVQFSRETGAQTGTFSGRVEHLSSGRCARFATTKDLLALLTRMVDELGEEGIR